MNRKEILKKAKGIIAERQKRDENRQKLREYIYTCSDAEICPICGGDLNLVIVDYYGSAVNGYECKNCDVKGTEYCFLDILEELDKQ